MGAGFGPALDIEAEHTLEELNILTPSEEHGLSFAARLSYRPDDFKPDEFGLFYNRSHIKREYAIEPIIEINQSIYGIFSYFGAGPFIFTGSFFAVENDFNLVPGGNEIDLFVSGYLQPETVWRSDWIFFVRGEGMQSDNDDRYLALFPEFEKERFVGGVRYEITKHQAVKVELSNILKRNERFNRVAIQWSSVFP